MRKVSEGYNGENAAKFFLPDQAHPTRALIWQTQHQDSASEPNRRGYDDDGDGAADEDDLDGDDNDGDWNPGTDDLGSDGMPDVSEVGCKGGYDTLINHDPAFDNYEPLVTDSCWFSGFPFPLKDDPDVYTQGNGIPDHGEPHVDEDYAAISDNDLYCSARDDNQPPGSHYPMGVEVIQKSYAWSADSLSRIFPFEYFFLNRSNTTIHQAYLGFQADFDIGPVNIGSYFSHDYACYDEGARTAYVHNPVDIGSTPAGVTILGTSGSGDAINVVSRWYDFTGRPGPGTNDSLLYLAMSADTSNEPLITPCGSPSFPSDVRLLIAFGPFDSLAPGDTLRMTVAVVVGDAIDGTPNSLLSNAGRAIALYDGAVLTSTDDLAAARMPAEYSLHQNFPNPFNPVTRFGYSIPRTSLVQLRVYNLLGELVETLVDGPEEPGTKSVEWNAAGRPSGVYFYRIVAGDFVETRKLVLLK